ncbi:DMT family transporter [Shimia abyssi]|uniref:EamA domain-containing membrane protein RarD n=1 Tax=Shimia abyssi TaxID=1662395 RepID=A0A2P8FB57_9RHOB|nr:DMT family transporter [Shimia abyssi]PSL18944.1 EamA domain-containing membrane protein RarD [Shimia abyssi]
MTNRIPLGPLSAVLAAFFFSINDVVIKFLSGNYALHEIVLARSIVALCLLLIVIVPLQGGFSVLRTTRLGMHMLRGACVVFANTTFFLGLAVLPLADAVAVFFISPLIITAMSAIFLAEKIGPRRILAVGAGMLGVLIMIRPGTGAFNLALLLPIIAAFAYATLHILTRKIGNTESAATMAVYIQIVFVVISGCVGLTLGHGGYVDQGGEMLAFLLREWIRPASADIPLLVLLGVASACGGFFISQAYRISEASMIAPLEYFAMPMAVIFGVLVFGEWPPLTTWIGMCLIIGAGLFVFWREARTNTPPTESPRLRR